MRYLGLDIGSRAIGVAIGESIATELTTIRASGTENFFENAANKAIESIDAIIKEEECDGIVVGLPMNEREELTPQAKQIKKFAEDLIKAIDVKVHFVNEALTTFMAEDILESQGLSIKEAKQRVDQLSASLILQQFLEENEQ